MCTALVTATKLIGADLVNAVYPVVVERLRHPKEHVRKKAVMALHWFGGLDPRREGPLAGVELDKHFRTMLCDKVGGGRGMFWGRGRGGACVCVCVCKAKRGVYACEGMRRGAGGQRGCTVGVRAGACVRVGVGDFGRAKAGGGMDTNGAGAWRTGCGQGGVGLGGTWRSRLHASSLKSRWAGC